jgi:hypothetical protein
MPKARLRACAFGEAIANTPSPCEHASARQALFEEQSFASAIVTSRWDWGEGGVWDMRWNEMGHGWTHAKGAQWRHSARGCTTRKGGRQGGCRLGARRAWQARPAV